MEVHFDDSASCLTARLGGSYSLTGMTSAIDLMAEECRRRRAEILLVDVSISGDAPLAERYAYAEHAAVALSFLKKCAAVAGAQQRVEPFTELVAKNRGFKLRVFAEQEEAIRWLTVDV